MDAKLVKSNNFDKCDDFFKIFDFKFYLYFVFSYCVLCFFQTTDNLYYLTINIAISGKMPNFKCDDSEFS